MLHKKILLYLVFFMLCGISINAQEVDGWSLPDLLKSGRERSLQAFRAKRQYALEYWRYRSFKSSLLPSLDLELEPFSYNRSFVERYDDDLNIDVYRQQQNLNSFARLSVNQNILLTGASVYLSSSFGRLVNYGENRLQSYNITPVRLGIVQPIMAFNALKWQKKTAMLELEKAKKEYIVNQQEINMHTVSLFFQWALASTKVDIAQENKKAAARLYKIGKKRYDLGSIEKDELLNLELENFTSATTLTRYEQDLETIVSDLKLFLNLKNLPEHSPPLPEMIPNLKIGLEEAQHLAKQNNPDLLDIQIQEIHADRDLDEAIKNNRFNLSVNASFGLNQQAEHFENAYGHFLDQQIVAIQFRMPIVDWGERKGNIKMAKMTRELADIQVEQDRNDVSRNLRLAVANFNLQEEQVLAALRARNIAQESYQITEKRFLSGQVDVLRLTSARSARQTATEQYIQSLQLYWEYYYQVQQITLYNFIKGTPLSEDFDQLLKID
ncbi:TolC family protein [Salegentibacter sp. Hel_I_6]|uniref:TolC family protein n=1 Tax=Salegentibacter sp. Hel_I_6 TaxID=1250278 RepID=UPI000567A0D8|nr:TolC family protein [Salegentibacter sp. Hel_I_6]